MNNATPMGEMPKYKCHKEVWALKIKAISDYKDNPPRESDGKLVATITPEDSRYAPFEVEMAWVEKFKPELGGYYVIYKDGYKSYSPAKAFEEGYTLIK